MGVTADTNQASVGTTSAHLVVGQNQTVAFKFSNLGIDQVMPGDTIDVNFDLCGTAGDGGELQPALLSEETIGGGATRDNSG